MKMKKSDCLKKLEEDCQELEKLVYLMQRFASKYSCDLGIEFTQEEIENHWTTHVEKLSKYILDKIVEFQKKHGLKSILKEIEVQQFKIYEEIGDVVINDYTLKKIKT